MLIELFCPLHFWSTQHYGSLSSQSYSVFRSTSLLVPPTCFGPPHMCAVCVNFKDRAWSSAQIRFKGNLKASVLLVEPAWLWRRYELEKGLRAFWCMTRCACCQFREEKKLTFTSIDSYQSQHEVWPPLLPPECTLPPLPNERWGPSLDLHDDRF